MNNTKIAILGGLMEEEEKYMGDTLLFDARTKTCNTLIQNTEKDDYQVALKMLFDEEKEDV